MSIFDLGNRDNTKESKSDYVTDENLLIDPDLSTLTGAAEYDATTSDQIKNLDVSNYSKSQLNDTFESLYHSNHIYTQDEIHNSLYTDTFRFGYISPSDTLSVGREYLFFTKPDLNIFLQDDLATVTSETINPKLGSHPFWQDLVAHRQATVGCLEDSYRYNNINDRFNHLLQNTVTSNLDVPGLTADVIDTPVNMYGVGYSYRGSSESSDDNPTFDLEFKDTKYLDVYHFFKAYEEYETMKHHGVVAPSNFYICNKILHDQFSIYKFIVDEDMETIIYYGKMYGVMPLSLPREVFTNPNFDSGISYSVSFKAAFYEDMKPEILNDFNKLSGPLFKTCNFKLMPYNPVLDRTDNRLARAAYIVKDTSSRRAKMSSAGYVYRLKWRGVNLQ